MILENKENQNENENEKQFHNNFPLLNSRVYAIRKACEESMDASYAVCCCQECFYISPEDICCHMEITDVWPENK